MAATGLLVVGAVLLGAIHNPFHGNGGAANPAPGARERGAQAPGGVSIAEVSGSATPTVGGRVQAAAEAFGDVGGLAVTAESRSVSGTVQRWVLVVQASGATGTWQVDGQIAELRVLPDRAYVRASAAFWAVAADVRKPGQLNQRWVLVRGAGPVPRLLRSIGALQAGLLNAIDQAGRTAETTPALGNVVALGALELTFDPAEPAHLTHVSVNSTDTPVVAAGPAPGGPAAGPAVGANAVPGTVVSLSSWQSWPHSMQLAPTEPLAAPQPPTGTVLDLATAG